MAIRIRTVDGVTVALCAAETDAKPGDIYLDDGIHHALSSKFGLDFKREGWIENSMADPDLVEIMMHEKRRDCNHIDRSPSACSKARAIAAKEKTRHLRNRQKLQRVLKD